MVKCSTQKWIIAGIIALAIIALIIWAVVTSCGNQLKATGSSPNGSPASSMNSNPSGGIAGNSASANSGS